MSAVVGLILAVLNLILWGCWPLIRTKCRADAPVFQPLYLLGMMLSSLLFTAILDPTALTTGMAEPSSVLKPLAIVIGGFLVAFADFLCVCSFNFLPYSIAFPIYTGFIMAIGTVLDFIIQIQQGKSTHKTLSFGLSTALLFIAVVLALGAVTCLALSDYYSAKAKSEAAVQLTSLLQSCSSAHTSPGLDIDTYTVVLSPLQGQSSTDSVPQNKTTAPYSALPSDVPTSSTATPSPPRPPPRPWSPLTTLYELDKWIYICLLAGLLGSLWSPLANFGGSGPNHVSNAYTRLIYYIAGQLCAVPSLLTVHSKFIASPMGANHPRPTMVSYLQQLYQLPFPDKLFGLAAGAMVGLGYSLNFLASTLVSPTVVFGIAGCEPLGNILIGVFVSRQLDGAPVLAKAYMAASTVMFLVAVIMMSVSAS